MPSTSPGNAPAAFVQLLPGAPTASLQALTSFVFRHRRYVAYTSGCQLNVLSGPTTFVQAVAFDEELVAVAAESLTGKIAVAGKRDVYVLDPLTEGWTKVWWEKSLCLHREDDGDEATWLSWGSEGEVLVGGTRQLSLFSTLSSSRTSSPAASPANAVAVEQRKVLWSKPVPSPVRYAAFSPRAGLIATCGAYDRLVKIWRRLSFEEGLFDHAYLPHPAAVTHLEWRPLDEHSDERRGSGVSRRHDDDPEVLYTFAADGVLRVWKTAGPHDLEIVVLHATVDLVSAIPQSPSLTTKGSPNAAQHPRYGFVLPADHFSAAVAAATARSRDGKVSHALEHLKETSSKSPDVIVTFDGHGRMSAWGLQSIGHKRRPETPSMTQAFHIAHAEDLALQLSTNVNARFQAWFQDGGFHLLAHSFDGHLNWWQGDVQTLFSPSAAGSEHLASSADWCGHMSNIAHFTTASDGSSLVSWSKSGEVAVWQSSKSSRLRCATTFQASQSILGAAPACDGHACFTSDRKDIVLWDAEGRELARVRHGLDADEDFSIRPIAAGDGVLLYNSEARAVLALANGEDNAAMWTTRTFAIPFHQKGDHRPLRTAFAGEMNFSRSLRDYSRLRFVAANADGTVFRTDISWPGAYRSHEFENPMYATFYTDIVQPSILEANAEVAGLASADGRGLTILELTEGYIEHQQTFDDRIGLLKAYQPSANHNLMAVGFRESVVILAQGRYEHHRMTNTWTCVRRLAVAGIGLQISCLSWIAKGSLVVGAGNGLFLGSNAVVSSDLDGSVQQHIDLGADTSKGLPLSRLASYLRRPLPLWHPSVLTHLVRHGKPHTSISVLQRLAEKLKFWSEGEDLHLLLEDHPVEALSNGQLDVLNGDVVRDLTEQLELKDLPAISTEEQGRLKHVLETLAFISEHLQGLDMCALRYLFSWKLQLLQMADTDSKVVQPNGMAYTEEQLPPQMQWREIAFASHSTTQQPLLDILVLHYDNKMTWPIARRLGVTAWLSDKEALEKVFEALAQSAYRAASPPDPTNASLYFLALHKKPTLLALWRIATWHKEQRMTTNFLKRDFSLPENQTAAKKNAYALMGKRRFEYAAAFFLLANDSTSATSLLAGQCEDAMLAIAVARLYGGNGSEAVRRLVEGRLMPEAQNTGDRWLMSWCHSALSDKTAAADALVRPLGGVRTWHQDDSTTLMLYQQLRQEPSEHEYQAVLRAARILRRMGLWLLAIELVSTWHFKPSTPGRLPKPEEQSVANGLHHDAPSILDDHNGQGQAPSMLEGFEQPVPATDEKATREARAAELLKKLKAKKTEQPAQSEKKAPTQFKEPDANSLLDSFGF